MLNPIHTIKLNSGTFYFDEWTTWNGYIYYRLISPPSFKQLVNLHENDCAEVVNSGGYTWIIL